MALYAILVTLIILATALLPRRWRTISSIAASAVAAAAVWLIPE